ncbi:MAG: sugar phosphate nucleotidyltransferase [Vicinamibacteria bacterium]
MKAVILARGLGTRMRRAEPGTTLEGAQASAAEAGIKALMPFERPFLDYALSGLADAGCDEACLVIGPEHQAVRERYQTLAPPRRIRVRYAVQQRPLGTADALLAARPLIESGDFLVLNGDNLYPTSALRALLALDGPGAVLFERDALVARSNIPPERVQAFALCGVDAEGCLAAIVEKPDSAQAEALGRDALVSMSCWRLPRALFRFCQSVALSVRGERELTQAIADAIRGGVRLRVIRSSDGVLDLSSRADVAGVAERLRGLRADP